MDSNVKPVLSVMLALNLLLTGCATHQAQQQADQKVSNAAAGPKDPLEAANRTLWDFNWGIVDKYLLRPTTVAYTAVMPDFARAGVRNAVRNLEEPSNTINSFLQGKGEKGFNALGRFVVNSTVGVLGLIDVATELGLARQTEDMDETFAVWGVDGGPFVMVPLLGPNDTRGVVGDIIDNTAWPYAVLNTPLNATRFLLDAIETRATLMAQEEQINNAIDPYTFVKSAFYQNKTFNIYDGNPPIPEEDEEDLDDFDAYLEELEDSGNN